MNQEHKQLLLKDLCARLSYGVNLHIEFYDLQGDGKLASRDVKLTAGNIGYCFDNSHWVDIKPYLRPMSSMTEEERRYLLEELGFDEDLENVELNDFGSYVYRNVNVLPLFDWLNAHHFDYRGLIKKGLALESPEGMYA